MQSPAIPRNEIDRTKALQKLGIMYTPAEERFDRITRLAARHFKVPTVLLSLVYKDVQWFKSVHGLNACSTQRDVSFCGHAIARLKPFVIENALLDERFADNPLVVNEPRVRAYAGQPVRDASGVVLGTLCLIDSVPRSFSTDDLQDLRDFASLIEVEIARPRFQRTAHRHVLGLSDEQRMALIDPLLACWNKKGLMTLLELELEHCREMTVPLSLIHLKLADPDSLVARFGQERMVDFERFAASLIRANTGDAVHLGFLGSSGFVLVCADVSEEKSKELAKTLQGQFERTELESKDVKVLVNATIATATLDGKDLRKPAKTLFDSLISTI